VNVFSLQFLLYIVYCGLQGATYRNEMEKHMYKGYLWMKILIDQPELYETV
jgi:hypothetical protein